MRRRTLYILACVLLTALGAVPTASPGNAVTATEVRAYMAKVRTHVQKAMRLEDLSLRTAGKVLGSEDPAAALGAAARERANAAELGKTVTRLAKVKPPTGFGEPHASLLGSIRSSRSSVLILAQGLKSFADSEDSNVLSAAFRRAQGPAGRCGVRRAHWKTELTALARRAGAAIPLWLKKVSC